MCISGTTTNDPCATSGFIIEYAPELYTPTGAATPAANPTMRENAPSSTFTVSPSNSFAADIPSSAPQYRIATARASPTPKSFCTFFSFSWYDSNLTFPFSANVDASVPLLLFVPSGR